MNLNRRDAIKTMSIGTAALMTPRWVLGETSSNVPVFPYTLPDLPYAYDALADFIDPETMNIHHTRHHQGYVNNLNAALEGHPELQSLSLHELIADLDQLPESIRTAVRNNGGGHANHSLFWQILTPESGLAPDGDLAAMIDTSFGSLDACLAELRKAALTVFGSGWAWLSLDGDKLLVEKTANQDSPIMAGRTPVVGIDVWEHAYYLRYQNRRAEYVDALLQHINWPVAGKTTG
jgi:Fe-Mn family superoxide dismutase